MTERARRAAKIRDARHTDQPVRHGNNKNTRKWCRGKVGRQHDPEWVSYAEAKNLSTHIFGHWRIMRCKNCRKELLYKFLNA